ncbi:MAG TPA: CheR family methyltransferase [Nostocaceae cyanobacterium]|nr:CheR family methyltransferase [Nostocaceae cyanobacterium]
MNSPEKDPDFENLITYLSQNRGFDFAGYKRSTLMRRVRKQMQSLNIQSFRDYTEYLKVYPEEFNHLFNTILINVTAFFRDALAWEYLANQVLPKIIRNKKNGEQIRIWSAGCASGEEAYTLAILMAEILGVDNFRQRVKIYATDIDQNALTQARQATYTAKDVQVISTELRQKYFEIAADKYIFRADLRRSIIFGRHDLLQDAPISRLDLLVCRNTLMYFNSETQGRILTRCHFALNNTGYLFLGKAEMLLMHSNLFMPVDLKNRIFTKVSSANTGNLLLVMANSRDDESKRCEPKNIRLRELAFDANSSAQVVIDINGTLVLMNQQMQTLFGLTDKDLFRSFHELELSHRPIDWRSLIERAYCERHSITLTKIERFLSNTEIQYLDVKIVPLKDTDNNLLGVSITFEDVTRFIQLQEELKRSRQELETINEELQSTNEELETTNEELQSTNEELETTNEELQSTNEELETINEELQSANEELKVINHEVIQRTLDLNRNHMILISILSSLQMGIVVIDRSLNILIWNYVVEDLWGLSAEEVINKSLFSLDIGLPMEQLRTPILDILSSKSQFEEIILDAINRRGKQIKCYLALNPLMSTTIEGVILMMADIEKVKNMISASAIEQRRRQ